MRGWAVWMKGLASVGVERTVFLEHKVWKFHTDADLSAFFLSTTLQDSSIFLVPKFLTLSDYSPSCLSCLSCLIVSLHASSPGLPPDDSCRWISKTLANTSSSSYANLDGCTCAAYALNWEPKSQVLSKQFLYRRGQPNKLNSWASWPDPCWSYLCLQRISDLQDLKLFLVDVFQGLYVKSRRGSFCDLFEIHAEMKRMQQCNTVVWSCGGNGGQNGLFLSLKSTNTVQSTFWNLVWEIQNQNNQASAVLAGSNYISLCWRWQHVWTLETTCGLCKQTKYGLYGSEGFHRTEFNIIQRLFSMTTCDHRIKSDSESASQSEVVVYWSCRWATSSAYTL